MAAISEQESKLPPVVADPAAEVHDLLIRVQAALQDELATKATYSQRLLDAQQALGRNLLRTIPIFASIASADGKQANMTSAMLTADCDDDFEDIGGDGREVVYADAVVEEVKL